MSDDLSKLLGKWKGIEPSLGFDDAVWKAIHSPQTPDRQEVAVSWWRLFPALAASVVLAVGIGLGAAAIARPSLYPYADHFRRMRPGPITGAYALLAQGGKP